MTLHVLPWGGELKASLWLLPPALHLGSGVLFTVFLPWEWPKTLPGWHMLVGEKRTGMSKQTGR